MKKNKAVFENFNISTGYPIKDVNTGSLFIDSRGVLWAGTGEKLVRFDYSKVRKYKNVPQVFIKSLKVQSQKISWHTLMLFAETSRRPSLSDSLTIINEEIGTFNYVLTNSERVKMLEKFGSIEFDSITPHFFIPQHLVLPNKNNNLTFEFGSIETGKQQMVRYQYILDGYDADWSAATNETSATFGNIQEGEYTFRLKVQSPDGVWGAPLTYTFRVLPPWYRTWWMYAIYLAAAVLFLFSVLWLNSRRLRLRAKELTEEVQKATAEILEQKKVVEEQKQIVEEKNKDILDSIHYAKRIQDALLRDEEYVSLHLPDHFILYLPKDIVSGDFYWGIEKKYETAQGKTEHFWYVAAVDCTGHGVPGAFMSMLGTVFLNDIINDNKVHAPADILDELRNKVVKELGQTGKRDESKDGMDISLIRLNLNTLELQWAGANNALNLIRDGELSEIKADKQPIGYYPEARPFTNHVIQLKKGDYIYLFSDGYADQFGGPKGKKFKYKQLEQLLVSNAHLPLQQQKTQLKKAFYDWKGDLPQVDDVCIIGIKV
ncbi:MAG: SpoIIE family protein phosphatase [Bacteroidia bacterium]|jgi:serine phosphatase RsbU (regulator of sigma subunit)